MTGLEESWPAVRQALFKDLSEIHEEAGPWELVLFTGDLVGRGSSKDDFVKIGKVLSELQHHLVQLQSATTLVAVPGNHDIARPLAEDPAASVLQNLWAAPIWGRRKTVADALFARPQREDAGTSNPYREVLERAFANYTAWLQDPGMPILAPTSQGLLPGDFSSTYEKDGVRLGLLGLNTAFLQLSDGMTEGSLALDTRQLQAACGGDIPRWASSHDICLLLTHHPPSWLRKEARDTLMQDLLQLPDSSFAVHLCGHLHAPSMTFDKVGDATPTRMMQGASLFGREDDGPDREMRIHGYSACQLDFETQTASVWPRIAERGDGIPLFLRADSSVIRSNKSLFKWAMREPVESTGEGPPLPPELKAALSRQVTIYKRDLRYRFSVLTVTDHEMTAELELSYLLVNAAAEPQRYEAGLPPDRPTEYIAASWDDTPVDFNDSQYRAGDHLIFPVQLPPNGSVSVAVRAKVKYGVPDSETLTTFIPSMDYELALVRHPKLRLLVQWQTIQQGTRAQPEPDVELYEATEPLLQNQGLRLTWRHLDSA